MPNKWYDNRALVIALLVAFFPIGFYALWKGNRFSALTKGVLTAVVALPILICSFQKAYQENRFATAGASVSGKATEEIQRMGVSYRQATEDFDDFIPMKKVSPVDGQDRYFGISEDRTALLEITGNRQAITHARLSIGVPNDSPDIMTRNTALLCRFLGNIVPEWPDSADWATTALMQTTTTSETSKMTIVGYKQITMTLMKAAGRVTVSVKHA